MNVLLYRTRRSESPPRIYDASQAKKRIGPSIVIKGVGNEPLGYVFDESEQPIRAETEKHYAASAKVVSIVTSKRVQYVYPYLNWRSHS